MEILVQALARVLLEVRTREPDRPFSAIDDDVNSAALDDGDLVLRDLIALREIRVEVVLAGEDASRVDLAPDGEAEADRALDGATVQYRQYAGKRDVDRRGFTVRRRAELGRGAGEDLRRGRQLRVRLETDDDFVIHVRNLAGYLMLQRRVLRS